VVAWGTWDGVSVYEPVTAACLAEIPAPTGHTGPPELVGPTVVDGRGVVAAVYGQHTDAEMLVWEVAGGRQLRRFGVWLGYWRSAMIMIMSRRLART
jgi:hypothetical protein